MLWIRNVSSATLYQDVFYIETKHKEQQVFTKMKYNNIMNMKNIFWTENTRDIILLIKIPETLHMYNNNKIKILIYLSYAKSADVHFGSNRILKIWNEKKNKINGSFREPFIVGGGLNFTVENEFFVTRKLLPVWLPYLIRKECGRVLSGSSFCGFSDYFWRSESGGSGSIDGNGRNN